MSFLFCESSRLMQNNAPRLAIRMKTPRAIWVPMKSERASQKPFNGNPYHAARQSPLGYFLIWAIDVFVSRPVAAIRAGIREKRLLIRRQSAHDSAMLNHAPLHSIEIIFYSAASLIAVAGVTWFFLK
jgi:hypothetical protein